MSDPFSDPFSDPVVTPAVTPAAQLPGKEPVIIEPAPMPGEPDRKPLTELELFARTNELVDDRFCKADKLAIFAMRQKAPR